MASEQSARAIEKIKQCIQTLQERLDRICEIEVDSALREGAIAATGFYEPERDKILSDIDILLRRWELLSNADRT